MGLLSMAAIMLPACASDSGKKSSGMYDRQEQALHDPFSYSPSVPKPDDISGGGVGGMDQKGLQRDVDHVINP